MSKTTSHSQLVWPTAILCWIVLQWNLPNLGNNLIPRNMFVGAMVCIACASCWTKAFSTGRIIWSNSWGGLLIPPLFVIFHAILIPTGSFVHYPWLAAGILGLMAFWVMGLYQLEISTLEWQRLSQILVMGSTMLCFFTLASPKYLAWLEIWNALPLPLRAAEGGFQQPNLLASFMATSLTFTLWLHVRQSTSMPAWQKAVLILLTLIHAFVVFRSGSRVGMLGLTISMVLLGTWMEISLPPNRTMGCWCMLSLLIGALLAVWLGDVFQRLQDLTHGFSTTSRLSSIWASAHLWRQSPWWGHGIGTFSELIVPAFVQLIQAGEKLDYVQNLGHPHNEVLLWAVETGTSGVLFIVGPWIFLIGRIAFHLGRNSLGWIACLFPIGLHQFTEFPFHSSTAHIWLWAVVIASGVPSALDRPFNRSVVSPTHAFAFISLTWIVAFGLVIFLVDAGWVSYQTWAHRKPPPVSQTDMAIRYQQERELTHLLLKRTALDNFQTSAASYWLANKKNPNFEQWCNTVLDMTKRRQNTQQWELEFECLKSLDKADDLQRHILKLQALGVGEKISNISNK